MSEDLSGKTVCVVDNGLMFPLAYRLAQGFGRVLYFTTWDEAYPVFSEMVFGDGFAEVERCNDYLETVYDGSVDLYVFPNRGHVGAQLLIESLGKRVFGAKRGVEWEVFRSRFRKLQAKLHMDVPEYNIVVGLSKLREYLEPLENKWIKLDQYRGNMETWKWRDWEQDHSKLDKLAVQFGPFQDLVPFIVEDEIKTDIEDGADWINVDGEFANYGVVGIERKDKTYLAALKSWDEAPDQIKEVLTPLQPELKALRYRNFISTEQRVTDDANYLTDITPRLGFPSGNCQTNLYANLSQVIWEASAGNLIPIEPAAKYAIECLIDHTDPEFDYRSLRIPKEIVRWINVTNVCKLDDVHHFPPNDVHDSTIGSVSGIGDTVIEAIENVIEHVNALGNQSVSVRLDTLKDLVEEAHKMEEEGIKLADEKLPEPEAVLNNGD